MHGSGYKGHKRLRTRAAADYLGVGKSTLEKWRVVGGGPRYSKIGPRIVVYDTDDLDEFAARGLRSSTSEAAA
jgi:predicted DNA-binding transcriptional regulator AlpA